jgi:hypothetical protein
MGTQQLCHTAAVHLDCPGSCVDTTTRLWPSGAPSCLRLLGPPTWALSAFCLRTYSSQTGHHRGGLHPSDRQRAPAEPPAGALQRHSRSLDCGAMKADLEGCQAELNGRRATAEGVGFYVRVRGIRVLAPRRLSFSSGRDSSCGPLGAHPPQQWRTKSLAACDRADIAERRCLHCHLRPTPLPW